VDAEYPKPYIVDKQTATDSFKPIGIQEFWNYVRHRLEKFNGVPRRTYYLHLKESEWRFNLHEQNLYPALMKLIESHPL
jgi:transposase-like protein